MPRTLIGAAEPEEPARPLPLITLTTTSGRLGWVLPGSGYFATTLSQPSTISAEWITWSATP